MLIFQTLRKCFAVLGLKPSESFESHMFNTRNSITAICLSALIISTNEFLFFEAKNFQEYTGSFYATWTIASCGANFGFTVWKTVKFFKLIDDFQEVIDKRKCTR